MSLADTQYLGIIENILEHGTYGQNRTGVATYKGISNFDYKICSFQNGGKRIVMDLANAI